MMKHPLRWIGFSVAAVAGIGTWQLLLLKGEHERLASALHDERTARISAELNLQRSTTALGNQLRAELANTTQALGSFSLQMDRVGAQSKKSLAILDILYDVHEDRVHGVVAVAPKRDDGALAFQK